MVNFGILNGGWEFNVNGISVDGFVVVGIL